MKLRKGWEITSPTGSIIIHFVPNHHTIPEGWIKKRVFILK